MMYQVQRIFITELDERITNEKKELEVTDAIFYNASCIFA
jgi:hypothetical protein